MADRVRVFVDTNPIIGAHRIGNGCWEGICGHFSVETVEACVAETQPSIPPRRGHIAIAEEPLRQTLAKVHLVSQDALEAFQHRLALQDPRVSADPGEEHLFAWLLANAGDHLPTPESPREPHGDDFRLATADVGALRIAARLGWLSHVVSLEWLARKAGAHFPQGPLPEEIEQFPESWLQGQKAKILR